MVMTKYSPLIHAIQLHSTVSGIKFAFLQAFTGEHCAYYVSSDIEGDIVKMQSKLHCLEKNAATNICFYVSQNNV